MADGVRQSVSIIAIFYVSAGITAVTELLTSKSNSIVQNHKAGNGSRFRTRALASVYVCVCVPGYKMEKFNFNFISFGKMCNVWAVRKFNKEIKLNHPTVV